MSARPFSQPSVVHALVLAVAERSLDGEATFSARILADDVAARFPHVPLPALRVIAAKALVLYFEPVEIADLGNAGLDLAEEATACEFFRAAALAEADALRDELRRREGSNVVSLSDWGPA